MLKIAYKEFLDIIIKLILCYIMIILITAHVIGNSKIVLYYIVFNNNLSDKRTQNSDKSKV